MTTWRIIESSAADALRAMPAGSVQTCVTSPPYYGLRDYGHEGQIGLEATPDEYVQALVETFREVRRVLRDDGTLWVNLGDSYASGPGGPLGATSTARLPGRGGGPKKVAIDGGGRAPIPAGRKAKDLLGIPWMVAFALRADGWYLRSDIIWAKPAPMPESVTDRPTKAHEYLFLLSKSPRYHYDADAIAEPVEWGNHPRTVFDKTTRNKRSVWTVTTQPFAGAHFATFPPKLIEPCVLAGAREGDTVLDPFAGSGTTGVVALRHDRAFIGVELNAEYVELARWRIIDDAPLLNSHAEEAVA